MLIRSKYPGRCRTCKRQISVGDQVYWNKAKRGVNCLHCGEEMAEYQDDKSEAKATAVKQEIPKVKPTGSDEYFTIDWPDFKEILKRAIIGGDFSAVADGHNRRSFHGHLTRFSEWTGTSKAAVSRWLEKGFKSEAIRGLSEFTPPMREKRRLQFVEEGDELHIDLAWNGADEYFSQWTKRESIPGVALEAGIMFAGSVSSEVITDYMTWLCKVAFSLESAGIDCQITLDFPSRNLALGRKYKPGTVFHNVVRVKKENERSDFYSWSPMLSPAALRNFGFALGDLHADSKGFEISGSFGNGMLERREWKCVYDEARRVIVIENCYMDSYRFPADKMTEQFRSVMQEMMGKT